MGEKIHAECLSIVDDRVFVNFDSDSWAIRTATRRFWKAFKDNVWVAMLLQPILPVPKRGQRLRITEWHNSFPVKIEVKTKSGWETIYELSELPAGHRCLAGCYAEK